MSGTSEGAKKAAETRKEEDPQAFKKMGEKGAEVRHDKSPEEESDIAKKSPETPKKEDQGAFKKMGEKVGESSQSGTSSGREK